jgi:hypothetical protein
VASTPSTNLYASTTTSKVSKRARSAYNFYAMDADVRAKVKQVNSDADFGMLSKLIGSQWKGLSDIEKQPYETKSHEDKVKVAIMKANAPPGVVQVKIKRARSAYTLYAMDADVRSKIKKAHPDADFGAISKLIGSQWKDLSTSDRQPYDSKSQEEKAKAAEEKAKAPPTATGPVKPKRARSAYTLYSMDPKVRAAVKEANPEADFGGTSKLIAAQWKNLGEADKKPYVDKSSQEKAVADELKAKNAPKKKRAKTAYLCYSTDTKVRVAAKSTLPDGAKVTEVAKLLGSQWKEMTDVQKQPYVEQSAKEKAALQAALQADASDEDSE